MASWLTQINKTPISSLTIINFRASTRTDQKPRVRFSTSKVQLNKGLNINLKLIQFNCFTFKKMKNIKITIQLPTHEQDVRTTHRGTTTLAKSYRKTKTICKTEKYGNVAQH